MYLRGEKAILSFQIGVAVLRQRACRKIGLRGSSASLAPISRSLTRRETPKILISF
jgi:hypothetical protein